MFQPGSTALIGLTARHYRFPTSQPLDLAELLGLEASAASEPEGNGISKTLELDEVSSAQQLQDLLRDYTQHVHEGLGGTPCAGRRSIPPLVEPAAGHDSKLLNISLRRRVHR